MRSKLKNIEKGIPTTEKVAPGKKPLTSKEITVTIKAKRIIVPAFMIIALAIVGLIIWHPWQKKEAVPFMSDKPSIAIMYFKNNTGEEKLDHWRSALSQWLVTDLTQSTLINVLQEDRLFSIFRKYNLLEAKSYTSEELKKVAAEGRVNHIFNASLSKAGDLFRIDYSLKEAETLKIVASDYVRGKGEESFPNMIDEITKKIKLDLNLSREQIASDIDKNVGKITSDSPEAIKFYLEGRKYFVDHQKSLEYMKKAISIDPEFAMAYRSLAMRYRNRGEISEGLKYFQKAFELSDRVSEREKYQIQADYYAESQKTYNKAIKNFSKLLSLYPDDMTGHNNLGLLYIGIEEWDKAIERLEAAIYNEELYTPYWNLARAYRAKGEYNKARDIIEYYLKNVSDYSNMHLILASTFLIQGEVKSALAELDKAIFLDPAEYRHYRLKGDIHHLKGEFERAESEYTRSIKSDRQSDQISGKIDMAALKLSQGKYGESKGLLNQGIELSTKLEEFQKKEWQTRFLLEIVYRNLKTKNLKDSLREVENTWNYVEKIRNNVSIPIFALHLKGLILLEMDSIDETQRISDELRNLIDNWISSKLMRHYYHLMGMVELNRQDFASAIASLQKATSLLAFQNSNFSQFDPLRYIDDHAFYLEPLAIAYYRSGDLENARKEFEKILSLTTGRLYYGDIYAKSFYMLGKICEQQGDTAKAIENYEKFLTLWKDADPGIAEVEEARNRLAGLKNQ